MLEIYYEMWGKMKEEKKQYIYFAIIVLVGIILLFLFLRYGIDLGKVTSNRFR